MSKTKEDILLQFKIGLAIKRLIVANKTLVKDNYSSKKSNNKPDDSYGKISTSTGIRSATISDIVNGKSNPKASTLLGVLEALQCSVVDFGEVFDSLTDTDVKKYMKETIDKP